MSIVPTSQPTSSTPPLLQYSTPVRVCFLTREFDLAKGGTIFPLLRVCRAAEFTILTNRVSPRTVSLPEHLKLITLGERLGPYEYGIADDRFARAVLQRFPPHDPFWQQFHLLHLNQTFGPALLKLRQTGFPLLYVTYHPVTADLEMALAECSLLEGLRWRARSFLLQRWQRRMCRECDHLLTDSHTVAKRLEEDYGCDPRKCSVLHLGVDLHLFQPLELTPAFDIIAIGSFLHPRKGFRYLLEVYRALAGEGYRIADIGRRSEEQGRMLRAIERVTTFGVLPERELVSLLQRSSVLISTSLYEGFGLTLLEALACGKPAFAFSVGAIPEVLGPHGGDLLVSPRDTAALIAKARAFLSLSLEERADWGQRYRAFVSEHFPLDRAAKALCALYEELHSRR